MSRDLLTRTSTSTFERQPKKPLLSTALNPAYRSGTHPIEQLQHALGNRAVAGLTQSKRLAAETGLLIQPKLVVGAAGDHYEREADHMASRVMTMPAPATPQSVQRQTMPDEKDKEKVLQTKPLAESIMPLVQRQVTPEDKKEEQPIQTKPLAAAITPFVQRESIPEEDKDKKPLQAKHLSEVGTADLQRQMGTEEDKEKKDHPVQAKASVQQAATGDRFEAGVGVETRLMRSKGGGSPLPDPVRAYMEPRFGVDFSGVRVHTSHEAAALSQAVGAQAFTHGQDIYFCAGKSPEVSDLTAHELTHVVQQTGGKQLPTSSLKAPVIAHRFIQRYKVPRKLECDEVVDWLDHNSPYSPEWAQTKCSYTFTGKLRISKPMTSGAGVSLIVTGHSGLSVSVSCPIDSPGWAPSARHDHQAVVAAWKGMKTSLDAHEQQHRAIGRKWRAILETRFRGVNFTVTGADKADAMRMVREEVAAQQQQWIADAQADQDAIDPFTGAILACP